MLRDNALKFNRVCTYIIPHKPIENGQYMNQNDLSAILKIHETRCFISETELIFNPCGLLPYKITTFINFDFEVTKLK